MEKGDPNIKVTADLENYGILSKYFLSNPFDFEK